MNFGFDGTELEVLFNDLNAAGTKVGPAVRAVVARGALNIKRDAAQRFESQRKGGYLPHYSRSIDYDLEKVGHTTVAVVGPNSSKVQGAFGLGVEYGSAKTPPLPHLNPALDAEEPMLLKQLGDAAVRVLS